jgi:pyridoxine 5'-phosphate synthase PdxJ
MISKSKKSIVLALTLSTIYITYYYSCYKNLDNNVDAHRFELSNNKVTRDFYRYKCGDMRRIGGNEEIVKQQLPNLLEVSIGHALICDSLYLGLENCVQLYLRQLK